MSASTSITRFAVTACLLWALSAVAEGITVLTPEAGDTLLLGESVTLTWRTDSAGAGSYVALQLYRGSEYDRTISSSTYNDGSYTWSPPVTDIDTAAGYRIKILSTTDSYLFGYSGTISFRDEATLSVTAPDSLDSLIGGSSHTIRWHSTGSVGSYVSVQFYRGSEFVQSIYTSTANDGSCSWTVPSGIDTTAHYRIKVASTAKPDLFAYSDSFRILDRWSLTITSPLAGDTFSLGSSLPIRWSGSGNPGPYVAIELYRHGAHIRTITTSTYFSSGSYSYTLNSLYQSAGSGYQVKLTNSGSNPRSVMSDSFVIVAPPSITVGAPTSGGRYFYDDTLEIGWSSTGAVGDNVKIDLYRGSYYERALTASTPDDGSFRWRIVPLTYEDDDYRVRVTSLSATSAYDFSDYFYIGDGSLPTLSSPAAGDTLRGGENMRITWRSTRIAATYITAALYRDSTYVRTIASSTYNDGLQSWTVPSSLPTADAYQVVITASSMQPAYSAMFTIDNTPSITITRPASDLIVESGTSVNVRWSTWGVLSRLVLAYSLDQGYHWSVADSSVYNDGTHSWSVPELDEVTACWLMLRSADDSLLFDMAEVVIGTRPTLIALSSPTLDHRPTFRWHSIGEGETYRIKIDTTMWFNAPLVMTPVADTFFQPRADLPAAKLYWQVTPTGMPSLGSRIDTVRIQDSRVPMPIAVKPDPTAETRLPLRWHPVEGASWYHLMVAGNPSFRDPVVAMPVSDTVFVPTLDLPRGRIYWKVRSDLLDTYSAVQHFTIFPDTVPILYGYEGDTVTTKRPPMRWKRLDRASSYRIEVYDGPLTGMPMIAVTLDDTVYTPLINLEPGRYLWRVSCNLAPSVYSAVDSFHVPAPTSVHHALRPVDAVAAVTAVDGVLRVRYATAAGGPGRMTISTPDGRRVARYALPGSGAGLHTATLPHSLPAGAYMIRLDIDGRRMRRRMTVLR